ncbi:hypothetical protein FBQ97_18855 [Acidobacteria bacterium ACD]|nr:hypothetical protein [Acidobacteria bacterium ACD]
MPRLLMPNGTTSTLVDLDEGPTAAEIVPVTGEATVEAATGNVAVEDPLATVTDAGMVTAPLVVERATGRPPDGAAALSVTVPVADEPDRMDDGVTVSTETW